MSTPPGTRPSSTRPSDHAVPYAVRAAASWSWRLIVIAAAVLVFGYALFQVQLVVVPALIALLVTALLVPLVNLLQRIGVPRGLGAGLTLVGALLIVLGLLSLVGQQLAVGFSDLADNALRGVEQVRNWMVNGPLQLSQGQINDAVDQALEAGKNFVQDSDSQLTSGVLSATTTIGHLLSGFLLAMFATFFFLYQGESIWSWAVRLFPRMARSRADSSGRRAWGALTSFVRATVLVALVDALGISLVAWALGVPLVVPIGVLVFLASFIPIVGAVLSGVVAILVALVAVGPIKALVMMAGVIFVQQMESHALQPFVLGRLVRLHPLAVVFAVAAGGFLAGIPGTLFAVPLVAAANAIVTHLAELANADADAESAAAAEVAGGTDGGGGAEDNDDAGTPREPNRARSSHPRAGAGEGASDAEPSDAGASDAGDADAGESGGSATL